MRVLFIFLILMSSNVLVSDGGAAEKYALLIGITTYKHTRMNASPLKYPESDATALASVLRNAGYQVDLLPGSQATRKRIQSSLHSLQSQGTSSGVVLIGLFGHGVQYDEDAYFGPFDTAARIVRDSENRIVRDRNGRPLMEPDPSSMVSMRTLLDALTISPAGNKILLADCCREDPSTARGGSAFGAGLTTADLPDRMAALFACSRNEQAYEHAEWGHGAFSRALLNQIQIVRSSGRVTAGTLAERVANDVRHMVRQQIGARSEQTVTYLNNGIVDFQLSMNPLDMGVQRLANAVEKFFDQQKRDKVVTVNSVVGVEGDGNALLRQKFEEALERDGFSIGRSRIVINGRFFKYFGPSPKQLGDSVALKGPETVALRLKAELRDRRTDDILHPISIPIFGDVVLQHLAPTSELPASLGEEKRQKKLNRDIDQPKVEIDGFRTKTTPESLFAVEIRVRQAKGEPVVARKPENRDGLSFVRLRKGEEFIVRLHNSATFETAVTLTIDGLSMYAFSKSRDHGGVLVPPGGFVDIPGWYISDSTTDQFEIMSYAQSAAAEKKIPKSNVGTITAAFHAAWKTTDRPPRDELNAKSADSAAGRGRRIGQRYEAVRRVVGKQRAFITVRYNR